MLSNQLAYLGKVIIYLGVNFFSVKKGNFYIFFVFFFKVHSSS